MHRWFRKCASHTTAHRSGDAARLRFEQAARLGFEHLEDRRLLTVTSFQDGVFPTVDYDGTRDAPIFGAQDDVNFGGEDTLRADFLQSSTGLPVWSLMKWELSSIPADATLNDVTLTVNVTNTTIAPGFDLFQVLTPWEESGVTWNNSTAVATWEEPGVSDPEDVDSTVLGTLLGTATGQLTIALNADGKDIVQQWINDPTSNHGLLMSNPANSNSLRFDSREAITPTNRPKLEVDFTFFDVDPPTVTLVEPLDGGADDQDPDENEVRVGLRNKLVIELDDLQLDDASVTSDTVAIDKDVAAFTDYTFSYDGATDQITLIPTAASFGDGVFTVTLSGGASQIVDLAGNTMPSTELMIEFDPTLPGIPVAVDDNYATEQGVSLVIFSAEDGVLGNDFDGNATVEAILVDGPSGGTLSLFTTGSFVYAPAAEFSGQDSFTYVMQSSQFTSNVATVTIVVTGQSPITDDDSYDATEEELLSVSEEDGVLANDDDPQGDEITAVLDDDVTNGTLTFNADGSFTYQPDENFFGLDTFTYRATDGVNESASTLVEINVAGVNDPPVAVDDSYIISANETLTSVGELPPDVNLVKWEENGHYYGIVTGQRDWQQAQTHAQTQELSGAPGHLVTITSAAENDFLMANLLEPAAADLIFIGLSDVDVEGLFRWVTGEPITFTRWTGGQPDNAGPTGNEDTVYTERNTDWEWNDVRSDFSVAAYVVEFDIIQSGVLLNDHDPEDDPLTAALVQDVEHGTLLLSGDGTFSYTPDPGFIGNDTFTYRANDGQFDSEIATVVIKSNASPETFDDAFSIAEDTTLEIDALSGVLANDADANYDELMAELVTPPEHGQLTLNDNGSFTYEPDENFFGLDTFYYRADDGANQSSNALVEITVASVNDLPVAVDDSYVVGENETLTAVGEPPSGLNLVEWEGNGHYYGFVAGNRDWHQANAHAQTLELYGVAGHLVTITSSAENEFLKTNIMEPSIANQIYIGLNDIDVEGDLRWVTGEPVIFTDWNQGEPNGGALENAVAASNTTWGWYDIRATTVYPGYVVEFDVTQFGVLLNDHDPEGDELMTGLVEDVQNGTLALNPDGSFIYTPDPGFVGTDRFTYVAFDGTDESAPATVSIEVTPSGPIAGRHVFYNNSSLDGQNPAAGVADNNAIATEKWVLLPGQTISPGKVFAGTQGINGLMIDIDGVGDAANLGPDDFVVRTGTGGDPIGWDVLGFVDAQRVPEVTVREGDGVGGSDRVTLTWPDGTLTNTYVEVTVLANGRTGLADRDVFYAASQVGDATGDLRVNGADLARVLAGWGSGTLPEQGNFDLSGTTGAADLATLFASGSPLDDFTAPIVNKAPITVDDTYQYVAGMLAPVGNVYADTIMSHNPLGYWRLGEAAASMTVEDAVGNHDGTYENIVDGNLQQPGALALDTDKSVLFDGVDDHVTVPHSPDLAISGDLTIELWMYKTTESSLWSRLVGKGDVNTRTFGVWEEEGNRKKILFQQYNGSHGGVTDFLSNSTVEINQWYHIVATVEGSTAKIYIDGEFDAQQTRLGPAAVDTAPLTFGLFPDSSNYFPGWLDEIAIYNYALSDEEIEEHYRVGNEGVGTVPKSVLANDVDVEGSLLTAQLVEDVQHGTLNLSANGNFSYVPDPGFVGTDQFIYAAIDDMGQSTPATVTIEVVPPADAAQAVDAVIVQAISGPEPETDPIIGPVEFPAEITSQENGRRLLRRIGRSFSHDAEPTDRQRLARQQAVDRVHEGEVLEVDAEIRRSRRSR